MDLPYTSNSILFWMDCAEKFVTKDSSNKIISIANRINDGIILPQTNVSQLTWVANEINGYPALTFSGAQSIYYDLPANNGSIGIKKPLILIVVAKITSYSPVFTLTMLRSSTNTNPTFYLFGGVLGTNKMIAARYDDAGANDFTPTTYNADTLPHIYTNAYNGATIKLRVDGVEKASAAATNGVASLTGNRLYIGTNGDLGFSNSKIAEVILYSGESGGSLDFSPEEYLKAKYNL